MSTYYVLVNSKYFHEPLMVDRHFKNEKNIMKTLLVSTHTMSTNYQFSTNISKILVIIITLFCLPTKGTRQSLYSLSSH